MALPQVAGEDFYADGRGRVVPVADWMTFKPRGLPVNRRSNRGMPPFVHCGTIHRWITPAAI